MRKVLDVLIFWAYTVKANLDLFPNNHLKRSLQAMRLKMNFNISQRFQDLLHSIFASFANLRRLCSSSRKFVEKTTSLKMVVSCNQQFKPSHAGL